MAEIGTAVLWDSGLIMRPKDAERPPVPEWYILLDVAPDLNTDIFTLAGIPKEEPYLSVVIEWVYMRREVLNWIEGIREARQRAHAAASG